MPPRSSYTEGTPNWVDLQTTDAGAAKAFYGAIFGWTFDDRPMPHGGDYSMALVDGQTNAAVAADLGVRVLRHPVRAHALREPQRLLDLLLTRGCARPAAVGQEPVTRLLGLLELGRVAVDAGRRAVGPPPEGELDAPTAVGIGEVRHAVRLHALGEGERATTCRCTVVTRRWRQSRRCLPLLAECLRLNRSIGN